MPHTKPITIGDIAVLIVIFLKTENNPVFDKSPSNKKRQGSYDHCTLYTMK